MMIVSRIAIFRGRPNQMVGRASLQESVDETAPIRQCCGVSTLRVLGGPTGHSLAVFPPLLHHLAGEGYMSKLI
jgi:hypothetical protein